MMEKKTKALKCCWVIQMKAPKVLESKFVYSKFCLKYVFFVFKKIELKLKLFGFQFRF